MMGLARDWPCLWELSWFPFDAMTLWLFHTWLCRSEGFSRAQLCDQTWRSPGQRCRGFSAGRDLSPGWPPLQ